MSKTNRRQMFQLATMAPLVLTSKSTIASANDRINHAVIGVGGQGRNHCERFHSFTELCQVVAVCDVDPARREKAARLVNITNENNIYTDYRKLLENPAIDSISIVTPDHWHAKMAMEAMQAGKHVYIEKPCCHNIREGLQLIECARQEKKCIQHGTQSRSGDGVKQSMEILKNGDLGKIRMAKAINHQLRKPIGVAEVEAPPHGVDYDLWLGPAPLHEFTQNRWHYNWHWFWDYGTGDIGNDGTHQIDVARWGLDVVHPSRVSGSGGQLLYQDDHQTPDTQTIIYQFADTQLIYEMRLWTDYKLEGHDNGTIFYGDEGRLEIGRDGSHIIWKHGQRERVGGSGDLNAHIKNFLECVHENDPTKLNAPITEGFHSVALCLLGNISTRVQNQLDIQSPDYTITNNTSAAILLGREYRKGYELPGLG